ncbi:putative alpha-glucosidase precursor [Phaeomoniella chlamydospora]|uniref:alpha-glucosidase n=1 Tax=Phaeomoniella chlamydospora TaxID=158046 RepID=A0A0G2F022_PHACM|nr:putative alpha-glucosidase precursor [Phaeomoniella chlamydospora]
MAPKKWLQCLLLSTPTGVYGQSSAITSVYGGSAAPGSTTVSLQLCEGMYGQNNEISPPGAIICRLNVQFDNIVAVYIYRACKRGLCPGYTAANVQSSKTVLTADLTLAGKACNVYGVDVADLTLTVEYQTTERLRVSIAPNYLGSSNTSWYILSENLITAPKVEEGIQTANDLTFSWSNDPSFNFNVTRESTGAVLYSTTGSQLVYENQFIEIVTSMPENYNLYGLGETIHGLRLGNNYTKTIYAADVGDPIDYNIYGSHPFYLDTRYYEVDSNGNEQLVTNDWTADYDGEYRSYSHGVYLRNAHGQEILLRPSNVTWRMLGGSIDLFFFSGPSQPEVTSQYLKAVGLPAMQQYHTFGFHQCRWGSELEDVVNNYAAFGIPLEHIWSDIDYMNQYRDFDNDANRYDYTTGQEFLSRLHDNGQYWVPIIDSAIYVPNPLNASDAYSTFNNGNNSNAFILNPDGSLYIGEVWPGYTVFPDWLTNSSETWWVNEMVEWHNKIPFDGAWLDMSEVSSFCVGSCGTGNITMNPVHPGFLLPGEPGDVIFDYPEGFNLTNATEAASASSGSSSQASAASATAGSSTSTSTSYLRTTPTATRNVDHPPYVINNVQGDLAVHAVAPNATHHDGTLEYDVHNLWGHGIIKATYQSLLSIFPGKRPFIIGRSTFAGSGSYAGHWGGDNTSKWIYMFFSIPQALSFQLFGIPMFGVDTCGFNGNTDEELCNRWMQLSAFFPFYRNHNVLSAIPQEAYRWSSVISATKTAMEIRFNLLPYMYTLFHTASTTGSTVMNALPWLFPNDPTLTDADRQFFLGSAILVTPVLTQGATTVNGVFPGLIEGTDTYYDWYNLSSIPIPSVKNTTLSAPLGHIPVHIRGNHILATQEMAMTTRAARLTPWSLLIALDVTSQTAHGSLYLDDGESLTPNATKLISFDVSNGNSLSVNITGTFQDGNSLSNLTVLGVHEQPKMNGTVVFSWDEQDNNIANNVSAQGEWDEAKGVLVVKGLEEKVGKGVWDRGNWKLNW